MMYPPLPPPICLTIFESQAVRQSIVEARARGGGANGGGGAAGAGAFIDLTGDDSG